MMLVSRIFKCSIEQAERAFARAFPEQSEGEPAPSVINSMTITGKPMTIDKRIQRQDTTDGSLRFVLLHPDSAEVQATATASDTSLKEALTIFGKNQQEVERTLGDALADFDAGQLKKVVLNDLKEESPATLQYVAWYIYRDYNDILFGIVHYNLQNSTTWPDDAPAFVRNRLRFDTHKMLVSGNREADKLLEIFKS